MQRAFRNLLTSLEKISYEDLKEKQRKHFLSIFLTVLILPGATLILQNAVYLIANPGSMDTLGYIVTNIVGLLLLGGVWWLNWRNRTRLATILFYAFILGGMAVSYPLLYIEQSSLLLAFALFTAGFVLSPIGALWMFYPAVGVSLAQFIFSGDPAFLNFYTLSLLLLSATASWLVSMQLEIVLDSLRRSEVKYKSLSDQLPVGIYRLDEGGKILHANPSLAQILGYAGVEQMLGNANLFALFADPADQEAQRRQWAQQGDVSTLEQQLRLPDGGTIWVTNSARVIRTPGGTVETIDGTLEVITERKLAQEALQRARDELEERVKERTAELQTANERLREELIRRQRAEEELEKERSLLARRVEERTAELSIANTELARAARLKDAFLASMSHELRTPLNAILTISETLSEQVYGEMNEKQLRSLNSITESGRHLLALINDILDLSKIGAGKLELILGPVAVRRVCEDSLRLIHGAAEKKGLQVFFNYDDDVVTAQADERRLKQILVNLLGNAVKFTDPGGSIGLDVVGDANRGVMYLTVWDTGIGIQRENMQNLFQAFVQLDNTLRRQYEGTGLGLALAYRMAELHGGGILVESQEGVGSRFSVTLPWEWEDGGAAAGQSAAGLVAFSDQAIPLRLVGKYLEKLGLKTVLHPRGEGILERIIQSRPDAVILLLESADQIDVALIRELKTSARGERIPMLVIAEGEPCQKLTEAGVELCLRAPVAPDELRQALRKLSPPGTDSLLHKALLVMPGAVKPHAGLVLLAEDNEMTLTSFSDYLQAKGFRVAEARSGNEAVERARELHPDLVLMDIQMPGMDGLEATRRIRAEKALAGTIIIAMTALAMPDDRQRCLDAGADDYISKPLSMKQLLAKIETLLARRTAQPHQPSKAGEK